MSDVAQIRMLEEQRRSAMLAGDEQALLGLLAPDLRYVHSTGVSESRGSLLAKLISGQVTYQQLAFDQLTVTCTQNAGVVSGEMRAQVRRDGELRDVAACYLAVWLRREGAWQLAAFQGTSLPTR
ncbi:MAG: nuclear transport factor 2 family protein [Variovorax sp.]|nr:MAG: nuclear transport factor 2 family protein [Variovorax sp.]